MPTRQAAGDMIERSGERREINQDQDKHNLDGDPQASRKLVTGPTQGRPRLTSVRQANTLPTCAMTTPLKNTVIASIFTCSGL